MKKLFFLLSIFAIVLSCSSDETSTPVTPPPAPIVKYTITLSAGEGGTVSTTGGEYEAGQTVSVTATPQGEYVFTSWSDGNTNATRTITISSNSTLTANFEKRKYPLTLNIEAGGEVIEEIVNAGRTTEYDSGTTVKLTAVPTEGYYFYAWKNVTVTGVDSSGNDIWNRHSSYGSFNNEIQITINNKFNITPIFLEKSPINQNKSWDFQGFVTPGWSGIGYSLLIDDFEEVAVKNTNRALNKIIQTGGNSVIIDYHIQHRGGINSNEVAIENQEQFKQLIPIVKMAEKLGLSVTIKTLLLTESHINPNIENYDWSVIVPSSPSVFFNNYLSALQETVNLINENNLKIDKWSLTNELVSLTTNENYIQEWLKIISSIKSLVDIDLGFNVRAANTPFVASRSCSDNVQEYTQVPDEIYDALDFIGLSIYKAAFWGSNNLGDANLSQQLYKEFWSNGPYIELNFDNNACGDCVDNNCGLTLGINYIEEINNFISSKNKDVYISEFGAVPYEYLIHPNWNESNLNVELDLELQKEYFSATLDVFKNSIVGLKGVYGYMFPLQEKIESQAEIDLDSEYNYFNDDLWSLKKFNPGNPYEWNISDKPALEAFRQYFRVYD